MSDWNGAPQAGPGSTHTSPPYQRSPIHVPQGVHAKDGSELLRAGNPPKQTAPTATDLPAEDDEGDDGTAADVFANYSCRSLDFGCPHPADVSESAGLALVSLPQAAYPLQDSLPRTLIETGKLSSLQLEGIQFACQRHCTILPDGVRAGFFLGDGAGIGKGRQISGILLDNWARGRKQHVWISTSGDLKLDAERDLRDLGVHVKVIDGCQELDAETKALGLSKDFKEGVLFVTYSTLIGGARGGKASRLDQIVKWCGGAAFEGVLVLDECHKAKNFLVGDSADNSTKTSKCVIELQQKMPRARVVYSSATGVTELGNLAYCERLGLWGKGSPFRGFEEFLNVVSKRGVFFLEMLAMELKRSGAYVSRGLSFAAAEFETVQVKLTPEQVGMYNAAARFWHCARAKVQRAMEKTNAGRTMQLYWSAHQRFFRQLVVSFKVDAVCDDALRCLQSGHAVVIGLQQTGEAVMTRRLNAAKGHVSTSEWLSSAKETILSFLEVHFPISVVAATAGVTDNDVEVLEMGESDLLLSRSLSQSDAAGGKRGSGVVEAECVAMRDELIAAAKDLDLPFSALDMFIESLGGHTKVAEMTGRTGRLVRGKDGSISYELRGKGDADLDRVNVSECRRFMDGEKHVAIISDAASTGISLHARRGCGNERRRVHFTVELPWSADKAVQQLGRSHRSNQASAPIYRLVVTDLGGERRFASAVAKRLQSLGALTKGDRRAAAGQDLQEFNLDTVYGKQSLRKVLDAIELGAGLATGASGQELMQLAEVGSIDQFNELMANALEFIGMNSASRKESETGSVRRFLGRLLGLPVQQQNSLYHYFFSVLQHEIALAQKEGRYSDTITDLFGGDGTVVERAEEPQTIFTDPLTGSTCAVHRLKVDRGMTWGRAKQLLDSAGHDNGNGFYESKRDVPGRNSKGWILATRKSDDSFVVARPNSGISRTEMEEADLHDKYTLRTEDRAQSAWDKIYHESVRYTRGQRVLDVALVCGSLVLLWNVLQDIVRSHALRADGGKGVTARDAGMKVVRVKVGGSEHLVGLRLPPEVIGDVVSRLREHESILSGATVKVVPPLLPPPAMLALAQSPGARFQMKMWVGDKIEAGSISLLNGNITVSFNGPQGKPVSFILPKGPGGPGTASHPILVHLGKAEPEDGDGQQTRGQTEPATSVDAGSLKKALTPPPTLHSFFGKASSGPAQIQHEDKDTAVPDRGKATVVAMHEERSGASDEVIDVGGERAHSTSGVKRARTEAVQRGSSRSGDSQKKRATPPTQKKPDSVASFFQRQISKQLDKPGDGAASVSCADTIDLTLD